MEMFNSIGVVWWAPSLKSVLKNYLVIVQLLVTIRGFSLAAAYMEEYKMSKQETTKGKKGLRKELKRAEAVTETIDHDEWSQTFKADQVDTVVIVL